MIKIKALTIDNNEIQLKNITATIADADSTTKGAIQLQNDLGGTASLPKVAGIQNIPIEDTSYQAGSLFGMKSDGKFGQVIPTGVIGATAITSETPITISANNEVLYNHPSATEILVSPVEVVAGSSITDTHNDFNTASNYVQQDSVNGTVISGGSVKLITDKYTKLMLHMNDSNFRDEIGHSVINNSVTFDSSIKKFGLGSAYFYNNSYLKFNNTPDFDLGINKEPFTIDFQFYKLNSNDQCIFNYGGGDSDWNITNGHQYLLIVSGGELYWQWNNNGSTTYFTIAFSEVPLNTFSHIEIDFDGTTTKLFINGILKGSKISTYYKTSTSFLNIGKITTTDNYSLNAYIDEFRIIKGEVKHTSDFTPPNSETVLFPIATPYYLTTAGNSNYSISTTQTITSLTIPTTTPANTSIKALFSVDNRNTWLYKDGTGIHKFTGDLTQAWANFNTVSDLTTYFTNLDLSTLTSDLSALGVTPTSLDFAFQLATTDSLVTPTISSITMQYITAPHDEFVSYGNYSDTNVQLGIKRINNSSIVVKNKTTSSKTIKMNLVLST